MKRGLIGELMFLFALTVGVFTNSVPLVLAAGILMLVETIEQKP